MPGWASAFWITAALHPVHLVILSFSRFELIGGIRLMVTQPGSTAHYHWLRLLVEGSPFLATRTAEHAEHKDIRRRIMSKRESMRDLSCDLIFFSLRLIGISFMADNGRYSRFSRKKPCKKARNPASPASPALFRRGEGGAEF